MATLFLSLAVVLPFQGAPAARTKVDIDLSKAFDTRSPWRFVASQDPSTSEPDDPPEPGVIHLCLRAKPSAPCDPSVAMRQPPGPGNYNWSDPHYLNRAKVVYSGGNAIPLFLLQAATEYSGDGDQAVFTQLLAYDRDNDRFRQIYAHVTGRNNNQEDRFITSGPLQGTVISVEPTSNAPFAYWVSVQKPGPTLTYTQVLRYRSATRYGDGNPLSVIDAEMPNIELHLGLWHPGLPLPVPTSLTHPCRNPRLIRTALWCG